MGGPGENGDTKYRQLGPNGTDVIEADGRDTPVHIEESLANEARQVRAAEHGHVDVAETAQRAATVVEAVDSNDTAGTEESLVDPEDIKRAFRSNVVLHCLRVTLADNLRSLATSISESGSKLITRKRLLNTNKLLKMKQLVKKLLAYLETGQFDESDDAFLDLVRPSQNVIGRTTDPNNPIDNIDKARGLLIGLEEELETAALELSCTGNPKDICADVNAALKARCTQLKSIKR